MTIQCSKLRGDLVIRYRYLIGFNISNILLSLAIIIMFTVMFFKDTSNSDPYHSLDENGCPMPKRDAAKIIEYLFYGLFFAMALILIIIESKSKIIRNIQQMLENLINQTMNTGNNENAEEENEIAKKIYIFINFESKRYLGIVYLVTLI